MSRLIDSFPEWFTAGIFTRLGTLFPDELPWANLHGQELDLMYFGNHSGDKETSPLLDKIIEQNRGNASPEILSTEQITTLANILYTRYGVQWDKLYRVLSEEYNPIENYSMVEEETPNITRTETPDITKTETPDLIKTETPDITRVESPEVEKGRTTSAQSDFSVTTDSDTASDVYGFNSNSPVPQAETNGNSTVTTRGDADKNVTTETETETGTRTTTETGTRTETETGTLTETETGTRTTTETGTRTETETGNRRLTRSGNIGVTTSQQMLESEIKLWEWNFYETVFKNVDTVLTVPKYNFYCRRFNHND